MSPRDKILIDHPTYPHAISTFTEARARLLPVAVASSGWDTAQLQAAGRIASLAYLIPDFHNPTGLCMPPSVRQNLRLTCPTVIDETMTDLALDGASPEPFAIHMPTAISIGSVSKSIWGGLRIGWIRATPSLLERVQQTRYATDLGTPVVEQLATAILLNEDQTQRPGTLQQLRSQRDALRQAPARPPRPATSRRHDAMGNIPPAHQLTAGRNRARLRSVNRSRTTIRDRRRVRTKHPTAVHAPSESADPGNPQTRTGRTGSHPRRYRSSQPRTRCMSVDNVMIRNN
ncbi:aminotransferase class I/II-fold pyridoxal phosphate-dependent enzyme [Streptomyces sp. NPDC005146]